MRISIKNIKRRKKYRESNINKEVETEEIEAQAHLQAVLPPVAHLQVAQTANKI